jgi:PAS domain S-box-containing protein
MCLTISTIPIGIIGGIEGFQSSFLLIGLIFLVTFVVSIIISYFITRPLEKLTGNINEISKGQLDVTLPHSEIHEINNLTDSLNRIMASLKLAIHKVGVKKGEIFEDNVKLNEESKKKQEDLFNSIPGWVWETDSKGIYLFCSNNISKFLGYNSKEMIGKSFFDYMLPEDVKKSKQVFYEASKKKKPINDLENWIAHKNGEKICFRTDGVPIFNESGDFQGYRGVNTELTSVKEVKDKNKKVNLKTSEQKIKNIVILNEHKNKKELEPNEINLEKIEENGPEHETDSFFIFDENANIVDCNEKMCKRLGYSKNEMLSLNIADFDAIEKKNGLMEKIDHAKKNGTVSFKTIHKRKDGSIVFVNEIFRYINNKNTFKCIVREDYSLKKSF